RLTGLLSLRNVRHVYDPTPGELNSKVVEEGNEVTLNKLKRASQPYRDIERFLSDEKVMQYIVGRAVAGGHRPVKGHHGAEVTGHTQSSCKEGRQRRSGPSRWFWGKDHDVF